MTNKWNRLMLCVVLAGLTSVWAMAQDEKSTRKSMDKRKKHLDAGFHMVGPLRLWDIFLAPERMAQF